MVWTCLYVDVVVMLFVDDEYATLRGNLVAPPAVCGAGAGMCGVGCVRHTGPLGGRITGDAECENVVIVDTVDSKCPRFFWRRALRMSIGHRPDGGRGRCEPGSIVPEAWYIPCGVFTDISDIGLRGVQTRWGLLQ